MNSILKHWDDRYFRTTILSLGLEEGSFYQPAAKTEIRCFVVVTLRNSPIETLQSNSYSAAGLTQCLTSRDVRKITSTAVEYFSRQNFKEMSEYAKTFRGRDVYWELKERYPTMWMALQNVALSAVKVLDYEKVEINAPYKLDEFFQTESDYVQIERATKAIYDGFDSVIEPQLLNILHHLTTEDNGCLIVDSFKALSRNVETLFQIAECLLTHDCALVTSNVYLKNGHVEKRMKPLRAGHTVEEMRHNLSCTSGLGFQHKKALNEYFKAIENDE